MQRFGSIILYQNIPKIKLFCKKMQNFQALGAPSPDPQNTLPLRISGYAPALHTVIISSKVKFE